MNLGSLKVQWFRYVPKWKGNRDAPEEEQMSLELQRLRPADDLATPSLEELQKWWRETIGPIRAKHPTLEIDGEPPETSTLQVLHKLDRRTKNRQGFRFEDEFGAMVEITDLVELFLYLPTPPGKDQTDGLWSEVFNVMSEVGHATAAELASFDWGPGGGSPDPVAPPVLTGDSPAAPANTQPEATG